VALSVSRCGARCRRDLSCERPPRERSEREREVVHEELQISHETVRTHVRNAIDKLGARSRAHLVARALAEGHVLA
jgi:DNA-binding NarL/FixJ family response regulator